MSTDNQTKSKDTKAKIIILAVTLVLTILFASLAGVIANKNNDEGGSSNKVSGSLYTGSNTVRLSGSNYVYYEFVPSYTAYYTFTASSSFDTLGALYNSSWMLLTSNDDGAADNKNFSIRYNLQANKTYYLGIKLYSGNSSSNITVSVTRG